MSPSRDRKGHPKSQQSSKVCLRRHAGSVTGSSRRTIGLQNRPERLRCAFRAVNTMLLAHCTKSLRDRFLFNFASLSNCFGHAVEPKNRPDPEKVDLKKHIKNLLKIYPKRAPKWTPKVDPRTMFLMIFSLLYPSWGPCWSHGRHDGVESTQMMPKLSQRVH